MGQIQDRIVLFLAVDAVKDQLAALAQLVENHFAGLAHRRQLRRVPEQHQGREDFAQVIERAFVEHRGLVDKADIQRIVTPFPPGNEVRAAQASGGERAENRLGGDKELQRAVQRRICQAIDVRPFPFTTLGQPFGQFLVLRVIDRGIENAVNGSGRHAACAQHRGSLVGGGQDRQRAPVLARAPLPIAGHDFDACALKSLVKLCKQKGFPGTRLADHGRDLRLAGGHRGEQTFVKVNTSRTQHIGHKIMCLGLIFGVDDGGFRHAHSLGKNPGGDKRLLTMRGSRLSGGFGLGAQQGVATNICLRKRFHDPPA